MMKKLLMSLIIVSLFISLIPNANAAARKDTLGYYEEKLEQYKSEARANQQAINKTEGEINSSRNRINSLTNETLALTEEIKKLTEEIENYEQSIKTKLDQSKQILEYLQLTSGRNVYLDYVFKATSITELINRSYAVKEIIDYNTRTINEMEQIIRDNESRQQEIDKRKERITEMQKDLESNIVSLGEKKESLTSGGIDIEKQIKIYEEQVNMYKKLGCKTNDVIGVDCAVTGGVGVFRRPTQTGYITQEAYYGSSYTHRAVDVGSKNGRKEKIYPIANGTITSIYKDSYGALCLTIEHYNINDHKYYTSLYVHMSSYAPGLYVGKNVTSEQYIGYMGDTGYAFGVHLHLEIFACRLYNPTDSNCSSWSKYVNFAKNKLRSGYNPRNLIVFPKGLYNSWSSR